MMNSAPLGEKMCSSLSPDGRVALMDDSLFVDYVAARLADLSGVSAVSLGGSRASSTHTLSSDWDFALYYRDRFDPGELRSGGWEGTGASTSSRSCSIWPGFPVT